MNLDKFSFICDGFRIIILHDDADFVICCVSSDFSALQLSVISVASQAIIAKN